MPTRIGPLQSDTAIAGQPFVPALPVPAPPQSGALPGPPGLSAYQIALVGGFVGTKAQWLASLGGTFDPGPGFEIIGDEIRLNFSILPQG